MSTALENSYEKKLMIHQNKSKAIAIRTEKKIISMNEEIQKLKRELKELKEARCKCQRHAMEEDSCVFEDSDEESSVEQALTQDSFCYSYSYGT